MIDVELAAFLQEGIAIQLGTRNDRLEPNGVRVVAVTVDGDGRHLVAYVPDAARLAGAARSGVERAGGARVRAAARRACLSGEGHVHQRAPGVRGGARGVEAQWDRWRDRLASIGVARATLEPWITWPCTAIRLRVTAIFNQTPGPNAGAPLA